MSQPRVSLFQNPLFKSTIILIKISLTADSDLKYSVQAELIKSHKLILLLANTFRVSYSCHLVLKLDTELTVDWLVFSIKMKKTNSCITPGSASDSLGLDPWQGAQRDSRPHLHNRNLGKPKLYSDKWYFLPQGEWTLQQRQPGPPQHAPSPRGPNSPLFLENNTSRS